MGITDIMVLKVIRQFKSKKNRVELCEILIKGRRALAIRKQFAEKISLEKEQRFHNIFLSSGYSVPRLLAAAPGVLFYDYITGDNYLHVLEDWEGEELPAASLIVWEHLADWLVRFYSSSEGIVLMDPNLRNFILDGSGRVWGVDFEECAKGDMQDDIALLLAHILTYSPSYTQCKRYICNYLIWYFSQHLNLSQEVLQTCLRVQLERLEARRHFMHIHCN